MGVTDYWGMTHDPRSPVTRPATPYAYARWIDSFTA